jgi:exosortase/archaeosortase family protein
MKDPKQKELFKIIITAFSLILLTLPLIVVFNNVITKWFENIPLYRVIELYVVPLQAKLVGVILIPLGFDFTAYLDGMKVNGVNIGISWNCIGWQSLLLFGITAFIALKGKKYTSISKLESLILGLLSVFLVNLARITLSTILAVLYRPLFVIIFHDYLAAGTTVIWLFFFWWFAYSFVLETKDTNIS